MRPISVIRAVRQNHALEHATIHVLSRRWPSVRFVGRSVPSGFLIYGSLSTPQVESAVAEALMRLQRGESYLAVHPRCGTNLVVTGLLAGGAAFGATLGADRSRLGRLPLAVLLATLASLLAQPVGHRVQERLTTTPELAGVRIAGVTRSSLGANVRHHVRVERE